MKKYTKKIVTTVVITFTILALFFLFGRDDKQESNGILWNGNQKIERNYDQSSISIPGFTEMVFHSNTTNQKVNLHNPESNNCSMSFSIIMQDNTVIWEENNIQPGYGLYNIQINKELEKGTYEGCVFTVRCFRDEVELNGCNMAFTLYVD